MATGGGGGLPDGDGGSPERQGGSSAEGRRRRETGFDIAAIQVDSEEDREARPEQGCSQLALASQCSSDPLRHYICDDGEYLWELYIQFDGAKFWSTTARRSEIRWLYLLGLMEKNGYGLCDSMYYVKEEGEGLNGLELLDSNIKVQEMLRKYERSRKLVLTVMRDKRKQAIVLSPVKTKKRQEKKLYARSYPSPVFVDLEEPEQCENNNLPTQASVNFQPSFIVEDSLQESAEGEENSEEEEGHASEDDSWMYPCQYDPDKAEQLKRKEIEEMNERIAKRKRKLDEQLYEDESEAEDIFDTYYVEKPEEQVKKKVKRQGPTSRSHSHAPPSVRTDWAPSDDEEDLGFLKEEDDDGFQPEVFVLPNGRKSRAKRQKERVWYDDTRENPEQQFRLRLCFKDVYQFRQALCRLHIAQERNFHYHRNCSDRIIVCCKPPEEKKKPEDALKDVEVEEEEIKKIPEEHKCPFFMSAAKIKHEV